MCNVLPTFNTARNIVLLNHQWLYDELLALGHNVIRAGWRDNQTLDLKFPWRCKSSEFLELLPEGYIPDFYLYFDDSSLPCFLDIENLPGYKLFFSVDSHHHLEWHVEFSKLFHKTLVAQKDFVKFFTAAVGDRAVWFPLWATRYAEPKLEKSKDVCFRGTMDEGLHPGRAKFMEDVASEVNLDYATGDYLDPYTSSKIVINEAVRGDVNFRVFEGMMCGALMLTPRVENGLFELFEEGESIVTFEDGNVQEAVEKIKYYLTNEAERERISRKGREIVCQRHSNEVVAKKLLDILEEGLIECGAIEFQPATIDYYASLIRYFWLFVRKYEVENMMPHLVTTINYFDQQLMGCSVVIDRESPTTEVSVVIVDSLLSDLLDENSYQLWLKSLDKGNTQEVVLINQLVLSFQEDKKQITEEYDNLRSLFMENRERFISSLSKFV